MRFSKKGGGVFRPGGARPPSEVMFSFIDQHRQTSGVEPICAVLPIAPSTYFLQKASNGIRRHDRRGGNATTSSVGPFSACGTTTSRSTRRGRCGAVAAGGPQGGAPHGGAP